MQARSSRKEALHRDLPAAGNHPGVLCGYCSSGAPGCRLLDILLVAHHVLRSVLFGAEQNTSPHNPAEHFRAGRIRSCSSISSNEIFRVNTRNTQGMIMDRNQGLMDRIFTMEGYTPLVCRRLYPAGGNYPIRCVTC